jgi:hypothetical protein
MFSRKSAGRDRRHRGTSQARVRITISAAERRKAWVESRLAAAERWLRDVMPTPPEAPDMRRMKAAILGLPGADGDAPSDDTAQRLRASLYPSGPDARRISGADPALESTPIRIAVTLMHVLLLIAAFPVGLVLMAISLVDGMSFRRTAHVTALTGVALSSALAQALGFGL